MAENSIAKAYVQVIPSAQGITSKLTGIFGKEGNSAGSSFGSSLIGKVKGLIAAAGIGKALGESLNAGADLQQSLGGIETLFKDSADIVIRNAEQAYKTAGMSANSYMEMVTGFSASLLQGLGGDTEKAAAIADMALTDMSDNANKMGTSMESIQNAYQGFAKQNYTMLDNLKLGYGGTKTEMERLLADAQKLTGVKYDISNLADVYEAIHVIQEEMGITGTTALESAETFSGSLASMKAAFSDLLANLATGRDIGGSLKAIEETVFTFVQGNLFPMIGNIFSELPEVLESALSMAIRGLNIVSNNADTIVQMGVELVTGIGTAIISAAPYLLEAALNIVMALGNAILSADWAAIGNTTISALRDNLDLAAGEILGTDGNIVESVITAISINLPKLLQIGVEMNTNIANGILQNLPYLLEAAGIILSHLLSTIMDTCPEILSAGITLILNLANGLIQNLPAVITSAISICGQLIATVLSHLPQLLESGISLIGQLAAGLIQAIPQVLAAIPQIINSIVSTFKGWNWREIGSNIVSGIANGISSGASAIISAARSAAQAALNAAKRFLGIASPSKVMRDQVGKFIPEGMAIGIEANTKPLTDAMHSLSDITTDSLESELHISSRNSPAPQRRVYGNRQYTFYIYGAEGQNVEEIAEEVKNIIQHDIEKEEASVA